MTDIKTLLKQSKKWIEERANDIDYLNGVGTLLADLDSAIIAEEARERLAEKRATELHNQQSMDDAAVRCPHCGKEKG